MANATSSYFDSRNRVSGGQQGLRGVTKLLIPCSTKADALTTARSSAGLDKGMKFCEENEICGRKFITDKQVHHIQDRDCGRLSSSARKSGYTYANKLKFVILLLPGGSGDGRRAGAAAGVPQPGDKLYAEVWQNDTPIDGCS